MPKKKMTEMDFIAPSEELPQLRILLPRTEKEFNDITKRVMKAYDCQNEDHVKMVIVNRIMHLPVDQAYVTLDYLGQCVIKNQSYQLARSVGSKLTHEAEINQLDALLDSNPNDQQALDALSKAVNEGSKLAEVILQKHRDKQHPDGPQV